MSGTLPNLGNTIAVSPRIVKAVRSVGDFSNPMQIMLSNPTATRDPTATDDVTQGYQPGSIWINDTAGTAWFCISNAAGAATWTYRRVVIHAVEVVDGPFHHFVVELVPRRAWQATERGEGEERQG